jgi:hypothetical protein
MHWILTHWGRASIERRAFALTTTNRMDFMRIEYIELRAILILLGTLAAAGCAATMAEIPTPDGNVLVVEGRGTKSMVAQKCLSADTIKKLISSEIPPAFQGQSCYWVALLSADSTDISKAISAFIDAKQEFDDKLSDIVAPGAVKPSEAKKAEPAKAEVIDAATAFLADSLVDDSRTLTLKAKRIPADQRAAVLAHVVQISGSITDSDLKTKIETALAAP